MHRGRFSATSVSFVLRKEKENHFVGLLTCAFAKEVAKLCGSFRLPGFPVTGFRHETTDSTYSGGTVRDFHPIILLSPGGSSPAVATHMVIKLSKGLYHIQNLLSTDKVLPQTEETMQIANGHSPAATFLFQSKSYSQTSTENASLIKTPAS